MEIERIKVDMFVYIEFWDEKYWGKVKAIKDDFDTYLIKCHCCKTLKEIYSNPKKLTLLEATPSQIKECLTKDEAEQRLVLEAL